jgi:hypothetical protein
MTQIKDYYIKEAGTRDLSAAFRWQASTIPANYKPWSIGFLMALQVALLVGVSLGATVYFLGLVTASSPSTANWARHLYRLLGWIPSSRATSATGRSSISLRRTASILNSRLYRRFFRFKTHLQGIDYHLFFVSTISGSVHFPPWSRYYMVTADYPAYRPESRSGVDR